MFSKHVMHIRNPDSTKNIIALCNGSNVARSRVLSFVQMFVSSYSLILYIFVSGDTFNLIAANEINYIHEILPLASSSTFVPGYIMGPISSIRIFLLRPQQQELNAVEWRNDFSVLCLTKVSDCSFRF